MEYQAGKHIKVKDKIMQAYQLESGLNEYCMILKLGKLSTGIALNKTWGNCFHGDDNIEDYLQLRHILINKKNYPENIWSDNTLCQSVALFCAVSTIKNKLLLSAWHHDIHGSLTVCCRQTDKQTENITFPCTSHAGRDNKTWFGPVECEVRKLHVVNKYKYKIYLG